MHFLGKMQSKRWPEPLAGIVGISQRGYVQKAIDNIKADKPFIMIADGVIIAHAGVDDGAKQSMFIIAYDARENGCLRIYGS